MADKPPKLRTLNLGQAVLDNPAQRLAQQLSGQRADLLSQINELANPAKSAIERIERDLSFASNFQTRMAALATQYQPLFERFQLQMAQTGKVAAGLASAIEAASRVQIPPDFLATMERVRSIRLSPELTDVIGRMNQLSGSAEIRGMLEQTARAKLQMDRYLTDSSIAAKAAELAQRMATPAIHEAILQQLQSDQFGNLLAQASERLNNNFASQLPPKSATEVAESIASVNIRELAEAMGDAIRDSLKDARSPQARQDRFATYVLPLILCLVQVLLQPVYQRWLDNRYPAKAATPPPPAATEASVSGLYVIAASDAVLRTAPSTQQRFVEHVKRDQVVRLVKTKGQWAFVLHGNHAGWIKTKYLRTLESVAASIMSVQLLAESQAGRPEESQSETDTTTWNILAAGDD